MPDYIFKVKFIARRRQNDSYDMSHRTFTTLVVARSIVEAVREAKEVAMKNYTSFRRITSVKELGECDV